MHPPLKRHESLQPFSRDHYQGLVAAQRLLRSASRDAAARRQALSHFIEAWDTEISAHFDDEERLLLPLISLHDHRERLLNDHRTLREMATEAKRGQSHEPDADWIQRLGTLLNDHIRWEERALFVELERTAAPEVLAALSVRTAQFEALRPRACAVRYKEEP